MDMEPTFGFDELFTHTLSDMAKAVSERRGESPEQQFARCQAAVHLIMGFQPRDVIEVMLAGHCVMVHEVMTVDVHASLRDEKRRPVVALNKAFNDNLDRLERYRQRPAEARHEPPVADAPAEPAGKPVAALMNRAARRQAARDEKRATAAAARRAGPVKPQTADQPNASGPAREVVAKCQANQEAMTALATGDPAGFARALGVDTPGNAFLSAAKSPGSPFDPGSKGPWPKDELVALRKP